MATDNNQSRVWLYQGSSLVEGNDGYYSYSLPPASIKEGLPSQGRYVELADIDCLVLLGVPGSGKTTEFNNARVASVDPSTIVASISLSKVNSFEFLQSFLAETAQLIEPGTERVVFFLDALDESPSSVPITEQWLISVITQGKKLFESLNKRFSIRLSCRTADWLDKFEDDLVNVWGATHVGIYELPPLKVEEIAEFIKEESVNVEKFLNEIANVGGQPLAARPVTLGMLLSIFKQSQNIPTNKIALYHQGLLALSEESNTDRRFIDNTGRVDVLTRFNLAAKLAATCILSNNSLIWDGTYSNLPPSGAIKLEQALAYNEDFDTKTYYSFLREVLKTSVFSKVSNDTYAWAHQTFAEFLTAYYLTFRTKELNDLKDFLISKLPENNFVIPQLREVAGWVSLFNHDFFEYLVETEPELLLSSDAAINSDNDKSRLTAALLQKLDEEVIYDNFEWRSKYQYLSHPTLSEQIQSVIQNTSKSIFARRAAFQIAEACGLTELSLIIKQVIFDKSEDDNVRVVALRALLNLQPQESLEDFKSLLSDTSLQDKNDEIKGLLLDFLWPRYLTAQELFNAFTLPQNNTFIGNYSYFLYRIDFSLLSKTDVLSGIDWLYHYEEFSKEYHFTQIIDNLLVAIWNSICDITVLKEFSKLIIWLIEHVPHLHLSRSKFLDIYTNAASEKREILLKEVLNNSPENWENAYRLTYNPWPIVTSNDTHWLLESFLDKENPANKHSYQELLFRLLKWEDLDSWNSLLLASDNDPKLYEAIKNQTFIELDSGFAKWKSEEYLLSKSKQEVSNQLSISEIVEADIIKTRENIGHWWLLNLSLLRNPEGQERIDEFTSSLDKGIWGSLPAKTHKQIIKFAKKYIYEYHLETKDHLKPNTFSRPSAAAYRAFRLLYAYDRDAYEAIEKGIWIKWLGSLLTFSSNDPSEENEIHSIILHDAFLSAEQEFIYAVRSISQEKLDLLSIIKLCDPWLNEGLLDLFWSLFSTQSADFPHSGELWKFFIKKEYTPAIAEALLTVEKAIHSKIEITPLQIVMISNLVITREEFLIEKLEILKDRNESVFHRVITTVIDLINISEFINASPNHPYYLAKLFAWIQQYIDESKNQSNSHQLDHASFFLSRVTNELVGLGSQEAVEAIAWLTNTLPSESWLKWSLNDVKANQRKAFHKWPQPEVVIQKLDKLQFKNLNEEKVQRVETFVESYDEYIADELIIDTDPISPISSEYYSLRIMVVATEWFSRNGGISTFNRSLSAHLVAAGHDVYCFVPSASQEEIDDAKSFNVKIITGSPSPGITEEDLLIAGPCIEFEEFPQLVIGHANKTGPAALRLAKHVFKCPYVHFLHTLPLDLEAHKPSIKDESKFGRPSAGVDKIVLQNKICKEADLIVAIGPLLYNEVTTELARYKDMRIIQLNPGLDESLFHINNKSTPEIPPITKCWMSGRMEDKNVKGTDITALIAFECFKKSETAHYKFIIRGYEESTIDDNHLKFMEDLGISASNIHALPYTANRDEIITDLYAASLVLMPSKCEAFGLAGLEAISAGIPALISKNSGLGQLLLNLARDNAGLSKSSKEYIEEIVIESNEAMRAVPVWTAKVQELMQDRPGSFKKASQLREDLKRILTWAEAVQELNNQFKLL